MSPGQLQLLDHRPAFKPLAAVIPREAPAKRVVSTNQLKSLDGALKRIFPSQHEESRSQKARQIMGVDLDSMADADLDTYLTQLQTKIDYWLDEYERSAFDDQTLRQILGGK
jgi:hypothetical protein